MRRLRFMAALSLLWLVPAMPQAQRGSVGPFDVQPCTGNLVVLQWTIGSKGDSVCYDVERSADTSSWTKLATVMIGDSLHHYFFIDANPKDGINFYRVRQTLNGTSLALSETKWVRIDKLNEFYIWPNPANDVLHIRSPFLSGSLEVLDEASRLVLRIEITNYTMDIFTSQLAKGLYVIRIRHGDEMFTQEFIRA